MGFSDNISTEQRWNRMKGKICKIKSRKNEIIGEYKQREILKKFVSDLNSDLEKILILPPDYTRKHSGAGQLSAILYFLLKQKYRAEKSDIKIMPALGTHNQMTETEIRDMFGRKIPLKEFIVHNWREDTVSIGEIPSDYVKQISEGKVNMEIDVEVNRRLVNDKYDLIVSIGQVLPHEVVGMANYNKNIFVGCGGEDIINKSHFIGAVYGMERLLGKDHSPVRKIYDYSEKNFLQDIPLVYILIVNSTEINPDTGLTDMKGLFIGEKRDIFEQAVELSQKVNINRISGPVEKVIVYLDREEFKSTWLGCKAIYRTRKIIADGGELLIIAPGLKQFGEDEQIDALIRKYGYIGKEKILKLTGENKDLRNNLSVAAHLIHGSTNDRFRVSVACKHLSRQEIESVNFNYISLDRVLEKYNPDRLVSGFNQINGEKVYFVENPATGLWDTTKN